MRTKKQTPQVRDSLDIKDKLDGPIADVIAALQELQKDYPDATVNVITEYSYGDASAAARLEFYRNKEPVEIERDQWAAKARTLADLRAEQAAFAKNGTPYPRADEIEALRKELGFFAMAPMHGMLQIHDGEVILFDMMRGGRRRDGSWVLRMMHSSSPELDKMYEASDAQYRL